MHHADPMKKMMSEGMEVMFDHPGLYTTALKVAPLANVVPSGLAGLFLGSWTYGHTVPKFAHQSFHQLWKKGLKDN